MRLKIVTFNPQKCLQIHLSSHFFNPRFLFQPKHRGIKFKTTGVTNQDLIQNEPPPIHKNAIKPQKFKTLEVDPTHLQPNTSNEKEESRTERSPKMEEGEKTPNEGKPKRRSIRFKFFGSDGKSESPKR